MGTRGLLGNLEQQDTVLRAEPGIPRLLAFTDSASAQIELTPRYAEVMAQSLFRAPAGHNLVDVLPGNTLRFTARALEAERDAGGFRAPVDVPALSEILSGFQWGLVLMWSKGLLALEDMRRRSRQSQLLTLLPLYTDTRRRQLEQEWAE